LGRHILFIILLAVFPLTARVDAEVRLPTVFGDHMVLQRNHPLPIWGWAAPGESLTVTLANETRRTTADPSGKWLVKFAPRQANNQPITLTVSASNTITLTDILIGEVWLCSGQSNMHWPLKKAVNSEVEAASANLPKLRLLNLRGNPYPDNREFDEQELANCAPEKYLTGSWSVCNPQTDADFSAVAFYFGRELLDTLKVPIGLIHNAIGGTPTEAWLSEHTLQNDPALKPLLTNWFSNELIHSFCRERAAINLRRGLAEAKQMNDAVARHPYQPGFHV
jgi:sialate O-acetylesterase